MPSPILCQANSDYLGIDLHLKIAHFLLAAAAAALTLCACKACITAGSLRSTFSSSCFGGPSAAGRRGARGFFLREFEASAAVAAAGAGTGACGRAGAGCECAGAGGRACVDAGGRACAGACGCVDCCAGWSDRGRLVGGFFSSVGTEALRFVPAFAPSWSCDICILSFWRYAF